MRLAGRKWTTDEVQLLQERWLQMLHLATTTRSLRLAVMLGRSHKSVRSKAIALGLPQGVSRTMSKGANAC